jgi:5'-nucleotidase
MHILLTNDDGILAPGLLTLACHLKEEHTITILAPERNWSASGHVKTMHKPLRVWETKLADDTRAYASDGAPSDCVALALLGFVKDPIDLVISGINPFANLSHDVTYSGTVTAAMEAAIAGVPGIAISLNGGEGDRREELDYRPAGEVTILLVRQIMSNEFPKGILLNINIPCIPLEEMRGIYITRQGQRVYRDKLVRRKDPRGRYYYWIGGDRPTGLMEPGTDFWALAKGFVSITPLQLDLTACAQKPLLESWGLSIGKMPAKDRQ